MKDIVRHNAGIFSALLALILILVIYTMLGTVDLVFMDGEFQVARIDDARFFSSLELDSEEVLSNEELEFTFGEKNKSFEDKTALRFEIAKTLVVNLFTFKGEPKENVIILTAK